MNLTINCYGYVRVSTGKQVVDGTSIDKQKSAINRWVEYKGHNLVKIYEDAGVSGRKGDRPKLTELISILKPSDILVAFSYSRIYRSARGMLNFKHAIEQNGAGLVSIKEDLDTTTPHGKAMFGMLAIFCELEANMVTVRTSTTAQELIRKGRHMGRPAYGWKKVSDAPGSGLEADFEQQKIIVMMHEKRKEKDKKDKSTSYNKIAIYLTHLKINPPGKAIQWHRSTVQRIMERTVVNTKGRNDV